MAKEKFPRTGKRRRLPRKKKTVEKKQSKKRAARFSPEYQRETARILKILDAMEKKDDFEKLEELYVAYNRSLTTGYSRGDLQLSSVIEETNEFVLAELNLDVDFESIKHKKKKKQNKTLLTALERLP